MTAPTITCPDWCTRTHPTGFRVAVIHETETVTVQAVPTAVGQKLPMVTTTVTRVDDEPTYICIDGDLLDADNAERLAYALLDQVATMRAERTLQVTR